MYRIGISDQSKIVQLLGGDIHIEREVGKGSVFSFEIHVEVTKMSEINTDQTVRRVIGLKKHLYEESCNLAGSPVMGNLFQKNRI